ncbi:MAG: hypothetical protein QW196_05275 [Sulfolobales archaeon]
MSLKSSLKSVAEIIAYLRIVPRSYLVNIYVRRTRAEEFNLRMLLMTEVYRSKQY